MPILFKCQCGSPGMASAESAGCQYTCAVCGGIGTVPPVSEPDCVLVYRTGLPNEGQVLDMAALQEQVASYIFTANDLIYSNDRWLPFGEVFEMPVSPENPPPTGIELAVRFKELPPMPGFTRLGKKHIMRDLARGFRNLQDLKKRMLSMKHKSTGVKVLYGCIVLIIIAAAYLFGIGKMVNYALWRPAYAVIYNPDDVEYTAELAGTKNPLPPGGSVTIPDIFVSVPSNRTLRLTGKDGNTVHSMSIPVHPLYDVLVNPDGKHTFSIFDLREMGSMQVKPEYIEQLQKEVLGGTPPLHIYRIADAVKDLGKELYKGKTSDGLYTSLQYDLSKANLHRSNEYIERKGKIKKQPGEGLLSLVPFGQTQLNFKNASVSFMPEGRLMPFEFTGQITQSYLPFDPKAYTATQDGITIHPFTGKLVFSVTYGKDGTVNVSLKQPVPGTIAIRNVNYVTYSGSWNYIAECPKSGKHRDEWKWSWVFTGSFISKGRNSKRLNASVTYSVDYDRTTRVTVKN